MHLILSVRRLCWLGIVMAVATPTTGMAVESVGNELSRRCPPMAPERLQEMQATAQAFGGANGLQVLRPTGIQVAPVSLRPMPFPRAVYEQVHSVMTDFNELVHKVSLDHVFINEQLQPVAKTDDFQRRLLDIYNACREEGMAQSLTLGVHRSDYMLHDAGDGSPLCPKQVEINTVASSFAGLSQRVTQLHQLLLGRFPLEGLTPENCPANNPVAGIAAGMAEALSLYKQTLPTKSSATPDPMRQVAVLFVVQPNEGNVFDQRHLEFELWQTHQVPVLRATLSEIYAQAKMDEDSRLLLLRGYEIGVVYYRAGTRNVSVCGDCVRSSTPRAMHLSLSCALVHQSFCVTLCG